MLVNFQPNLYCPETKSGGFAQISIWNQFPKAGQSIIQDNDVLPIYNTQDNSVPYASPPPIIVDPDPALSALLIVFAAISLMVISASFFLLFYYRENKIIKMSQPLMIIVTLIGSLASTLRVLYGAFAFTPSTCSGNLWYYYSIISI